MKTLSPFGNARNRLSGRTFVWLALAASTWAESDYSTPYVFTTLAGATSIGSADGPAAAARFYGPANIAADAGGNIYVADTINHTIRKISPAGMVTTLAGLAGETGSGDGPGSVARFLYPEGVAVDVAGNVYVADTGNQTTRKISPDGVVSTFAGSAGAYGSVDGLGSAARFNAPRAIAVDPAGNVLVADTGNYTIRKISPAGAVTTLAGSAGQYGNTDGIGPAARFNGLTALTVDAGGSVYVADGAVRKVTPSGEVSTFAPGVSGSGIAIDSQGNVYLSQNYFIIGKVTPAGAVSTVAGTNLESGCTDGIGSAARFGNQERWGAGRPPPSVLGRYTLSTGGLCFDRMGNLYVADTHNNTIRRITPVGAVTTVAGLGVAACQGSTDASGADARFGLLTAVAVGPDGDLYLADPDNHVIRRVTPGGQVTTLAGTAGLYGSEDGIGNAARFHSPAGIAVDRSGTVYVADTGNQTIRRITPAGFVSTWAGSPGEKTSTDGTGATARFNNPHDLAVDSAGTVYVADSYAIRKITPDSAVTTLAGSEGGFLGWAQPDFSFGSYYETVAAVALDAAGNVYASYQLTVRYLHAVEFALTSTVRKFTSGGVVSISAGSADKMGSDDGPESQAGFNQLRGLAVDGTGAIYLADSANHLIRRIDATGVVTTLGGLADAAGSADGIGRAARFNIPTGLALDVSGTLYVTSGNTIRKGQPAGPPVITTQPQSQTVTAGSNVQFSVVATGVPAPTYQWFFNGSPFTGAVRNTLSFANANAADVGDYTVVVTNALGTATSNKATLTVTTSPTNPPVTPTPPVSSGGGGGGGAPSAWFALALLGLVALRRLVAVRAA